MLDAIATGVIDLFCAALARCPRVEADELDLAADPLARAHAVLLANAARAEEQAASCVAAAYAQLEELAAAVNLKQGKGGFDHGV